MMRFLLVLFCCSISLEGLSQQEFIPVSGIVVTSGGQETLPGAVVKLKDTNQGVVTDENGNFLIELPPGNHILEVSFLGFSSKEVNITVH